MGTKYKKVIDSLDYEKLTKSILESLVDLRSSKVFHLKKYIGKKSGHEHAIDISIETEIAGFKLLILVECKHYKKTVEISDVLEFAQRLDDIGAHKGVMVSTIGFQEGARKIARANGIALVITEPVWQTIMPSRDSEGKIKAFSTGGIVIGGDYDKDTYLLRGITAVSLNYMVNITPEYGKSWQSIINHIIRDSDPNDRAAFIRELFENQFSNVCPYCGEQIRTPRARQCISCRSDWHNLETGIEKYLANN